MEFAGNHILNFFAQARGLTSVAEAPSIPRPLPLFTETATVANDGLPPDEIIFSPPQGHTPATWNGSLKSPKPYSPVGSIFPPEVSATVSGVAGLKSTPNPRVFLTDVLTGTGLVLKSDLFNRFSSEQSRGVPGSCYVQCEAVRTALAVLDEVRIRGSDEPFFSKVHAAVESSNISLIDVLLEEAATLQDGGFAAAMFLSHVLFSNNATILRHMAASLKWWIFIGTHLAHVDVVAPTKCEVTGFTRFELKTPKSKDHALKKLLLSRMVLYPLPSVTKVTAKCASGTSTLKLIACSATQNTATGAVSKTGWAKHAVHKSERAFVTTVSGHSHSASGTISLSPQEGRNALLVCGELQGTLELQTTASFLAHSTWSSILSELSSQSAIASLNHLFENPSQNEASIGFLLSTGSHSDPTHVPESSIAPTLAACRASNDHWKPLLISLITCMVHLSGDLNGSCSVIRQRWLLIWRPVLQGDDNQSLRESFARICDFLTNTVAKGSLQPAHVLDALFKLIETGKSADDLLEATRKSSVYCTAISHAFPSIEKMPVDRLIAAFWPLISSVDFLSIFAGGPSDVLCRVDKIVFSALRNALELRSSLSTSLIQAVLQLSEPNKVRLVADMTSVFWTSLVEDAYSLDSNCVAFNTISCSLPSARISATVGGSTNIDVSSMDDFVVRAQQSWRAADKSSVKYMEVTLASEGFTRIVIGLSSSLKKVESVGHATSSPHYIVFNDDLTQFAVGKGDIIGCGVDSFDSVFFTINGVKFHSESLRKKVDGSFEHPELAPFVFFTTTNATASAFNFGESAFAFNVGTSTSSMLSLLSFSLSSSSSFFEPALNACLSQDRSPPLCVHNELKRALSRMEDAHIISLASKLADDPNIVGGDLLAEIIHQFDFVELDLATLSSRIVSSTSDLVRENSAELRAHTMMWATSKTDTVRISGNTATLKDDEDSHGFVFGPALPNSDSVCFTISLKHNVEENDERPFVGSFFVGVSKTQSLDAFSWRSSDVAWALHKQLSEQLPNANLPPRPAEIPLFNGDSTLMVTVNRRKGTIEFNCDGDDLGAVFKEVPEGVPLYPFVQIVGDGSSAFAVDLRFQAPRISHLLRVHSHVALLRSLLVSEASSEIVSRWLLKELEAGQCDALFAVMGSSPDPLFCTYAHPEGTAIVKLLREVGPGVYRAVLPNGTETDLHECFLYPLDTFVASKAPMPPVHGTSSGLEQIVTGVGKAIEKWSHTVLNVAHLEGEESKARFDIESHALRTLRSCVVLPPPGMNDLWSRNGGLLEAMLSPVAPPRNYTFSVSESHSQMSFPAHYGGSLALAPMKIRQDEGPFTALGNEAIPLEGQFNVRFVIDRDWLGLLPFRYSSLSDKFSVGVATLSYRGEARIHAQVGGPRDLWSIPAIGTKAATLPNSTLPPLDTRYFNSMDKIRLCINRSKGTIELFVTPLYGAEVSLGVAFTDLPPGVDLYPFAQLGEARSSVMLLPDAATLPRPTTNAALNLKLLSKAISGYYCDGCIRSKTANSVSPPNWYRCNQCSCYDLCHECFASHTHPGHTFTQMKLVSAVPSPLPLAAQGIAVKQQQTVEVCALPLRLAKLIGQGTPIAELSILGTSSAWSGAAWGAFRRSQGKAPTEVRLRFRQSALLPSARGQPARAIFGVGSWSELDAIDGPDGFEALPFRHVAAGKYPSVISADTACLSQGSQTRSSLIDFTTEDTLSIHFSNSEVILSVRGIIVKSSEANFSGVDLAVFVSFTSAVDIVVELYHPNGDTITGKLCEFGGLTGRVASGANGRWCDVSQMREPLTIVDTAAVLSVGLTVYVVDEELGYKQCVVTDITSLNDNVVALDDGADSFTYAANRVWVPSAVNAVFKEEVNMPYRDEKARMRRFYKKYAPEKTEDEMDLAIQKFSASSIGINGMFSMLVKKYGPEPEIEIVRPVPKALAQTMGQISTSFFRTLSRLLFIVSQSDRMSVETCQACPRLKDSLLNIMSMAPPTASSQLCLLNEPVKSYVDLPKNQRKAPKRCAPSSGANDSVSRVRFVLSAVTSHFPCIISFVRNEVGVCSEVNVSGVSSEKGIFVTVEQIPSGHRVALTSDDREVHRQLSHAFASRACVGAYRTPSISEEHLFEIEVVGGTLEGAADVFWWSVDGHNGHGRVTGLHAPTGKLSPLHVFCDEAHSVVHNVSDSLKSLSRGAANARSCFVSPGDPSTRFLDIAIQPLKCDRFCLRADTDQLMAIYDDALANARTGQFVSLLPRVARHAWLRTKDTERILKPLAEVVQMYWKNADLLRNLSAFSEGDSEDSLELKALMKRFLTPMCRHFDILTRNKVGDSRVLGAALDAFYSLDMSAQYLPLKETRILSKFSHDIAAQSPLPSVKCDVKRWSPVDASTVWTTSLVSGTVTSCLNVEDLHRGGSYFEVVQPATGRVILTVASDSTCQRSLSFDGVNAKRSAKCWKAFGYVMIREGDVLGCHVRPDSVVFSVNNHRFAPISTRFVPTTVYASVDHTDTPLVLYSTEGSAQYAPEGSRALHDLPKSVVELIDYNSRASDVSVDNTTRDFIARTMASVLPYVDRRATGSQTRKVLLSLKNAVGDVFRRSVLAPLHPLKKAERSSLPTVSVKWYKLFSPSPRDPSEALRNTVLAQLHSQLSREGFYETTPMFITSLSMTESAHTPVDAGGPYMAVWGLVSEEIMTTESQKPNFHRNPMFVLTDSKDRKVMVPNRLCLGFEHLYKFLGVLMGHMARAKTPMALDLSPFVWKVMVGDDITIEDYFEGVDGFHKALLEDEELLSDESRAAESFPGFEKGLAELPTDVSAAQRKKVAEQCVLHLLDQQLLPMREGLALALGEDRMPFMTWQDLERSVCGDPNPTFQQVRDSISCSLPEPQQSMFWAALEDMSPLEWGQFFAFCSAQRRYPLSRKIVVVPDSHASVKHLPVAQTCFSQLRMPLYSSKEQIQEQLRKCIGSNEMELA